MPIFPAGGDRRRRAGPGITLVELMVVLLLLSLMAFLAVPAFQNLLQGPLDSEIKRLTGVMRLLRNEAVLTRTRFRLVFDLKRARYTVEERTRSGEFSERKEPKVLRPHQLPASFRLKDVVIYGRVRERKRDAVVPITIDASGFIDPFLLHFSEGGKDWTLKVLGFTGRVALEEGYVDYRTLEN